MAPPLLLLLAAAAAVDGEAALRHASALAALGPHPGTSPRARAAAEYVAAELRQAGVPEVRVDEFPHQGRRGANVVGVLRGSSPELVVVGAHHDTSPDDVDVEGAGAVGVLLEVARVAARQGARPRTLMFVSWEGWTGAAGRLPVGAEAHLRTLARESAVAGVIALDGGGAAIGVPRLEPLAWPDPFQPGRLVAAPAGLARPVLAGAGPRLAAGPPGWGLVRQVLVRTLRLHGDADERPYLQAGLPALTLGARSGQQPAPPLEAAALQRWATVVEDAVEAVSRAPRPVLEPQWLAGFGQVVGRLPLLALGLAAVLPGLLLVRGSSLLLAARVLSAAAFGAVAWFHPVPAVWCLAPASLFTGFSRRAWVAVPGLAPAVALAAAALWWRSSLAGSWLAAWQAGALVLALGLLWVGPRGGAPGPTAKVRGTSGRGKAKKGKRK